jgi:hypothetical protein
VFGLFAVLMALAHGGAALMPPGGHSAMHYRVIFTIWAAVVLLTPALCFFALPDRDDDGAWWRLFWTFSYLAFLTHIYWTVIGTFHGDLNAIFHSQEGVATEADRVVEHPGPDFALVAVWGLDVVLAWTTGQDRRWRKIERLVVHILVFVMFVGATVLASKASVCVHALGIAMTVAVLACATIRGWAYVRSRRVA